MLLSPPLPGWWRIPGDQASTWLFHCLEHSPSVVQALLPAGAGALPSYASAHKWIPPCHSPHWWSPLHLLSHRPTCPERPGQMQPLPLQPLPEPGHLPQRPFWLLPLCLPQWLQGNLFPGVPSMEGPISAEGKRAAWGLCHAPRARCLQDHPLPAHHSALPSGTGRGEPHFCGTLLAPTSPSFLRARTARWHSVAAPPTPAPMEGPASLRRGKEPGSGECWMETHKRYLWAAAWIPSIPWR